MREHPPGVRGRVADVAARQRAALVLCDVLAWPAVDAAGMLELSVPAVNSALQRAHLRADRPAEERVLMSAELDQRLLTRFVAAFEAADLPALTELFRRDVGLEMPPVPTWFAGRDSVAAFFRHRLRIDWDRRLVPNSANGCPAAATYLADPDGVLRAHNIQVLELEDGRIAHIYAFLDTGLFAAFGLPLVLGDNG